MRAATWIAMACLLCGVVGCGDESAPGPVTAPAAPATKAVTAVPATVAAATGPMVLEAEKCTLKDCQAKDLPAASGGKAVLFDKESSEAQGTVELKKGQYKVQVYIEGLSPEEDAVYITVGDGPKTRIFSESHGSVMPGTLYESDDQFFTAAIDKDGPCKVLLTTAEKNVYVDRVVFTPQK